MVMDNHNLKERCRASIGAIKELKRRWAPVSKHLVTFQSEAIRGVTSKRDLGLLGLFVVLMQWGDFALPHGFIKGLPRGGLCPSLRSLPPVEAIAHSEVLAGWEEHNAATIAGVRSGSTDSFVLEQSTKDHKEGFCTPRCVITQASGKQRLIDDGRAIRIVKRCQQTRFVRSRGSGRGPETIGRMPTATVLCHDRRPWPVW